MATTTKTRARAEDEDEKVTGVATASTVEDDEDDDEEEDLPAKGRAASYDDDDDLGDDDDDDESIVIGGDWEEAEAPSGDFPVLARGNYVAMLANVETRKGGEQSQNPGKKYAVLVFKVQAEDNPSKMAEDAPTVTIWQNLFFTPKSLGRTKQFVSDMGIAVNPGDDVMALLREEADAEAHYEVILGMERRRREDPNTGKLKNYQQNKILKVTGPTD